MKLDVNKAPLLNEQQRGNPKLLHQFVAIVGICFAFGAVLSFAIASYLNRGSIQHFLSFDGPDGPSGYANSVNPSRLGVHYFGDYLLSRWQSQMSSPWFFSSPLQGPLNNYLPFTIGIFWLFSRFSYWTSFLLFMFIPLTVFFGVTWKALSSVSVSERLQVLTTCVVLTAPFISLMDRGNVQIYLTASLALSLYLFLAKHETAAAISLGFAIALKGYPIFLISLWIRARRWKDVCIAGITALLLTLLPLLFYDGGVLRNISRVVRNIRIWANLYVVDSLAYNNSLRGSLLTLSKLNPLRLGYFFEYLSNHFMIIFVMLLLVCCLSIAFLKLDRIEIVLLSVSLMSIFVDFVGSYALSIYFLFIIALSMSESRTPKWMMRFLMFLIAVQMAPKGFPIQFWRDDPSNQGATYNSLLGGISSLLILCLVVAVGFSRHLADKKKLLRP